MWLANEWNDYKLKDCADGEKLEMWKSIMLCRPDPQAIWREKAAPELWKKADARYLRSNTGGGRWQFFNKKMPEKWTVNYKDLTFNIKPMGFKHTGLFPEQAVNWDWLSALIKNSGRPIRILNLFAYTGGATVAALASGAEVVR